MQINVKYLENLQIEAYFDDFKVLSDQPVRYKGDGKAPGPFDYFLASSAMCAAYFVKVYCNARNIDTNGIEVIQNNSVDPDNRYHQNLHIHIKLPEGLSEKDKSGIVNAVERCSVKRVIQNSPRFEISCSQNRSQAQTKDFSIDQSIKAIGKDASFGETLAKMNQLFEKLGINIEISSWRNPLPNVWSVHIRDADSPLCYTNGKGTTKEAALCSAMGEYFERLGCNYFYNDFYLGRSISESSFVHYPSEKWFKLEQDDTIPLGLLDEYTLNFYNPDNELKASQLVDTNSANLKRGVCSLAFTRMSDNQVVYIPVNILGNLYVSNGMSAGNSKAEARVQAISEIFERAIKNKIITEEIALPDIPDSLIQSFSHIALSIKKLAEKGFKVLVKDASLGGVYPVCCVAVVSPLTGSLYASFGSHPKFEIALERSLTELMQGRSFEGLIEMPAPSFNSESVTEINNLIDHFIDSSGVISWKFLSKSSEYQFKHWNTQGDTLQELEHLLNIFKQIDKEVYIADYDELGFYACRVVVPNFSEIYPVEDLIWDNNNRALLYREDILNLHTLSEEDLEKLYIKLEESELDERMPISELIGIAFDETNAWGRADIGELKIQINLKLSRHDMAKDQIDLMLNFNDLQFDRKKYYHAIWDILKVGEREDIPLECIRESLDFIHGKEWIELALETLEGHLAFYQLPAIDSEFNNIPKHKRLIESYHKIHQYRNNVTTK